MDETTPSSSPSPSSKGGGSGKTVGIVILVIILALLAWYFTRNGNNGDQTLSGNQTASSTEQVSGQPTSLKNLMNGNPQKCTVSYSNNNTQSQGTIFVNHNAYRGDFTTQTDGKTVTMHMISDGQTMWTWQDGTGVGYKMSTSVMGESASTTPGSGNGVDPSANYNYDCSSWNVVNSTFTPPADYNFTDMSAMMNTNASSTGTSASSSAAMKAQQCAACGSLTGSSQAQCKAALSCP